MDISFSFGKYSYYATEPVSKEVELFQGEVEVLVSSPSSTSIDIPIRGLSFAFDNAGEIKEAPKDVNISIIGLGIKMASTDVSVRFRNALPSNQNLRVFSDPIWAFLLGPQSIPGTYSTPGMTNMENAPQVPATLNTHVSTYFSTTPIYIAQSGTISVTNGSPIVNGVGTSFTGKVGRTIRIPDGSYLDGYRYFIITSVTSATQCTIGMYNPNSGSNQNVNWGGSSASGLAYAYNNTAVNSNNSPLTDFNGLYNYYDGNFSWFQCWAKYDNMDPASNYLVQARLIVDHLAQIPNFWDFAAPSTLQGLNTSPRTAGLISYICRAYDGKPNWWGNIDRYVDYGGDIWLGRYKLGGTLAGSSPSVRDGAYMLMFTAILGAVHPTPARRAYFAEKAIAFCIDPVQRKMDSDNSGYSWYTDADGTVLRRSNNITPAPYMQPFLNSLQIEALIWVHRMMRKEGLTGDSRYAIISDMILGATTAWMHSYQTAANGFDPNTRAVPYIVGKTGDIAQGIGGSGPLTTPPVPGAPYALLENSPPSGGQVYWDTIVEERQQNADGIANMAYAYALSGDPVYLSNWQEIMDSCFRFTPVYNSTIYGSIWYQNAPSKLYNQHFRMCLKGPAWIMGGLEVFS